MVGVSKLAPESAFYHGAGVCDSFLDRDGFSEFQYTLYILCERLLYLSNPGESRSLVKARHIASFTRVPRPSTIYVMITICRRPGSRFRARPALQELVVALEQDQPYLVWLHLGTLPVEDIVLS
jgi:hypothetical protein